MTAALFGNQEPRLSNRPAYTVSDGAIVGGIAKAVSMELFPWQNMMASYILARDPATGKLRFPTVGFSVPRQSGKTFFVMLLVIADSLKRPGLKTIWTTHRYKVTRETFNDFKNFLALPQFAKHIKRITTGEGNQGVYFTNGSRIIFSAREHGALRGLSKIGRLVLDEAQILSVDALSDLTPTMNTHPDPQVIYMGTPPRPVDNGEAFTKLRTRALEGDPRALWFEWSAKPGADLDDPHTWIDAHPSLGLPGGTEVHRIADLRTQLVTDENFAREALGQWDEVGSHAVIPMALWDQMGGSLVDIDGLKIIAAGLDVSPDRSQSSVSVAVWHPDRGGVVQVETIRSMPGVDWVVPYLRALHKRRKLRALVVDTVGPAAALIEPLRAAGLVVTTIGTGQVVQASGLFYDRALEGTLAHTGGPELTSAVAGASTRKVGDSWTWSRRGEAHITPLVSASFALFGLIMSAPAEEKKTKQRVSTTFYSYR